MQHVVKPLRNESMYASLNYYWTSCLFKPRVKYESINHGTKRSRIALVKEYNLCNTHKQVVPPLAHAINRVTVVVLGWSRCSNKQQFGLQSLRVYRRIYIEQFTYCLCTWSFYICSYSWVPKIKIPLIFSIVELIFNNNLQTHCATKLSINDMFILKPSGCFIST